MPASKDPKSYVRPVPLPVPSCKGVKLLARDKLNFNLESPSREEVFISNYFRRQNQLSNMGFRSASHKPYMGIGDPFYLDEKKMILHALGQWTEEHASSSSSSDESDEEEEKKDTAPKPAFTAAKFVLRRSRKDLNTLNKAVVHGRNMIRNVSLGHGLFDLIDKEKQHKKEASEEAIRKRREQLRNEFQPPKTESDDDTDDDMNSDVDLANYMVPVAPPTFLTQQQMDTDEELGIVNDNGSESDQSPEREPEIITFSGMALAEHEEEYQRARSAMVTSEMTSYSRPVSRRKKKQETPRPYTPQHTNLSANISMRESVADSEPDLDITRDALFRQLCVLHWILEAMSTDPPSPMTPIMSCWSLTDIGGSRAQPKKLMRDKATESGWVNFLSKDNTKKVNISPKVTVANANSSSKKRYTMAEVSKRLSTTQRLLMNRRRPVMHTAGRNSAQSSATGSVQGSNTGLNTLTNQMSMLGARNREDDLSPRPEDEEDQMYNKSIFKFLDEYYESLKTEEEAKKKNELDNKSPSSTPPTTPVPEKKVKDKSPKRKKKKDGNEKRLDHKVAVALGEEEKMTSRYLRANAHMIRPKSSPALQDFQAGLPSSKKISLCADLHNQFAECREEKALTLHDILDHKESQRLLVCKSKFVSLQGMKRHGSSFHRAVEQMRTQSWQQLRKPVNDRKKSVAKGNWYTDLLEKIPLELKQEWFYSKILQKLGNFGLPFRHRKGSSFEKALVEGTGKQSIYKFIKVLEGLREWEICCPDITAAVEFCRERIVEMTVDEYESWFTQRFPKVTRPQTAPPATKSEKKDTRLGSGLSSARKVVVKRPTQSAFTRRVQH
ncbi:coiled-coil domain-containing protein 60-like isoform X7 [Ruditapes philippinarum]|uniref:coiled-coil domain-containing protein 60-like isoform X7 n=1 Tax=Ruditapes philippinarum TaxID=129788 RepID=UPI00295BE6D1|nr:coiled-coil domain-containing protein 60-like isoform X7 [Ruditapes philippinarum]